MNDDPFHLPNTTADIDTPVVSKSPLTDAQVVILNQAAKDAICEDWDSAVSGALAKQLETDLTVAIEARDERIEEIRRLKEASRRLQKEWDEAHEANGLLLDDKARLDFLDSLQPNCTFTPSDFGTTIRSAIDCFKKSPGAQHQQ